MVKPKLRLLISELRMQSEGLEKLRQIIQKEIQDLQGTIEETKWRNSIAEGQIFSRTADRNDMIRINTLRWVIDVMDKLK